MNEPAPNPVAAVSVVTDQPALVGANAPAVASTMSDDAMALLALSQSMPQHQRVNLVRALAADLSDAELLSLGLSRCDAVPLDAVVYEQKAELPEAKPEPQK